MGEAREVGPGVVDVGEGEGLGAGGRADEEVVEPERAGGLGDDVDLGQPRRPEPAHLHPAFPSRPIPQSLSSLIILLRHLLGR